MKFRKRPVVIEAFRWDGDIRLLAMWAADADLAARKTRGEIILTSINLPLHVVTGSDRLEIDTLEGTVHANPGDWVICGVKGEFYPCRDDIFRATYEAVE